MTNNNENNKMELKDIIKIDNIENILKSMKPGETVTVVSPEPNEAFVIHRDPKNIENCMFGVEKAPLTENMVPAVEETQPLKPLISFNTNIYTSDNQAHEVPSNIYSTLININSDVFKDSMDRFNHLANNNSYASHEANLMYSVEGHTIDCICYNFINALLNRAWVYLTRLNDIFVIDGNQIVNFYPTEDKYGNVFDTGIFHPTTGVYTVRQIFSNRYDSYSNNDVDTEKRILDQNYLTGCSINFVNDYGMKVYSYVRSILNMVFAKVDSKKDPHIITRITSLVDAEFCILMKDFTYEASVFVDNIIALHNNNIMITPTIATKIRSTEDKYFKKNPDAKDELPPSEFVEF